MRIGTALIALLFTGNTPLSSQSVPRAVAGNDGTGLFRVGERLVYDVRKGVLPLGKAEMTVVGIDTIQGVPAAHVHIRLTGNHYLIQLDNKMDSWIALEDTTSRRFIQDNHENRKARYVRYDIFPDSGYYREKDSLSAKGKLQPSQKDPRATRETVAQPLDDAAFFFFVRTMKLEPGRKYQIDRYFRPDRNPVVLDVLERDTLDLPAGKFPTIRLQPIIKGEGILKEAAEARMWLTDDDRHLMVQLMSKFPVVGYLTMRLIRIEGPGARGSR